MATFASRNGVRGLLLSGVASIAISISTGAWAQTQVAAAEASDAKLEEITVTAQKRETDLQTTPIAISVLGAEDLKNRNIQSLEDLMNGGVPSLRIAPFFSRSSALTVGIRGIVPFDANQPSRDAGVGVYIDGVYLGRSQGLGAALYDVERIEILKGPQGTLFGRNSTGGAVSIVTKKPAGEFKLKQTGGISNYGGYTSHTHLDLPTFNNVSLKVDGVLTKRDGTVDNPLAGESDFNSYDRRGVHTSALIGAGDNFSALYSFDTSYDATTPYYVQLLEKNPASAPLAPVVQVQSTRTRVADIGVPQEESIGKTHGHALNLTWNANDSIEVRSISSYRKLSQTQLDNAIGAHSAPFVPNARFSRYSLASIRQSQYSQEFQLVGSLPQIEYVGGLYYYREKGDDDAWTPNTMQWDALGAAPVRLPTLQAGQQTPFPDRASNARATSYAIFGQGTWTPPLAEGDLHLTVGLRNTHDKKNGTLTKVNGGNTNFTFDISSDHLDPAFTIAYDATSDIHLYGKWGTAYRAGGANSRSVSYRSFEEENVETFEAGVKAELLDQSARVNLAAYSTRYKNIQIDFSAVNLNSSNRGTLETVNAPGIGKIKGIEADASIVPLPGLTLTASYAYTDSRLPQARNPFNNAIQNVFIVYTPDHAFSSAVDYEVPMQGATLRAHLDANVANGYNSSSSETTLTSKSFVVNGRLSVGDIELARGAKFQVGLWSRNLFNEQHTFYRSRASFAGIGAFGMFNEPRTFGIDGTISF